MATSDTGPTDVGGPCALFDRCGNFVHSRSELCAACVTRLTTTRNEFYAAHDPETDEKARSAREAFSDWVAYGDVGATKREYLRFIDRILRIKETNDVAIGE